MIRTITLFLAATIAAPAMAQTAPAPATAPSTGAAVKTGATVYDPSGAVVGTIASTDGTNAVVNTGTVKAAIALSSFGKGAKGPVLGLTKAQLEAQVGAASAQADAAFKAKLVPGAAVYGSAGTQIGTIKTAAADTITITTPSGDAVLPTAGFGPGPNGVTIGLSADQLAAQMKGAGAAPAPSTPGTTPDASTTPPGATTTTTSGTATSAAPAPAAGMASDMTTASDTSASTAAPTTPAKPTTKTKTGTKKK